MPYYICHIGPKLVNCSYKCLQLASLYQPTYRNTDFKQTSFIILKTNTLTFHTEIMDDVSLTIDTLTVLTEINW